MAETIELYLIRHGLAAARGDAWPDDTKRPLTHKGIARMRREAEALTSLGVTFDQIVTSPLVRTRQTAEILAEGLASRPPLATSDALAPAGTVAQAIEELGKYSRRRRIAVVGHEPNIGELAAKLIGARAALEFKKGGICRIDLETLPPARPGRLRWFATPKMLRSVKK
jgi:phosphohistidine phosphatase